MINQVYAINKKTYMLEYGSANLYLLKNKLTEDEKNESDYLIVGDLNMKHVSRITYVDGKCVYNNVNFWRNDAVAILEDYDEHSVIDFLGAAVNKDRFQIELNNNQNRISGIEGIPGEVCYNIEVGNEFISLFREECIFTDFETISPLQIAQKLLAVISLVQTGSFREAKAVLKTVENDEFLTEERIQKYIDMLDAADSIEYATEENHYDKVEETEEPAEEDK